MKEKGVESSVIRWAREGGGRRGWHVFFFLFFRSSGFGAGREGSFFELSSERGRVVIKEL